MNVVKITSGKSNARGEMGEVIGTRIGDGFLKIQLPNVIKYVSPNSVTKVKICMHCDDLPATHGVFCTPCNDDLNVEINKSDYDYSTYDDPAPYYSHRTGHSIFCNCVICY